MRTLIICTTFLAGGLLASAQQYPPQQYPPEQYPPQQYPQQQYPPQQNPNDPAYQQGNPYERGPYGEPRYQAPSNGSPSYGAPRYSAPAYGDYAAGLFERVQADLTRAESGAYRSQDRFEHARHEVYEFQVRLSRGRFDRGKLDHAIEAVQHAADTRWIRGRDRTALLDDAARMREFRASQGGGYYGQRPPYAPGYRY